jgi:hypothetical protein
MILSRDARELKCVRERVSGRRRVGTGDEESVDAWVEGKTSIFSEGTECSSYIPGTGLEVARTLRRVLSEPCFRGKVMEVRDKML